MTEYLVSVGYDGANRMAYQVFYNPDDRQLTRVPDTTGHLPYCLTKGWVDEVDHPGFLSVETVNKFDALEDDWVGMTKIYATDPLAIGGRDDSIREFIEAWEADIRYTQNYIYDTGLQFPRTIPNLFFASLDIEVRNPNVQVPKPVDALYQVTCASIVTPEKKVVLLLESSEINLLRRIFSYLESWPFWITFNGDEFDLRYLYYRAIKLGFRREEIPIRVGRDTMSLTYGIHIDLYRFFKIQGIRAYIFANKYKEFGLDPISKALLGRGKIELKSPIAQLSRKELEEYCLNDAQLTYDLCEKVIDLIMAFSHVTYLPMDQFTRVGLSVSVKSILHREHRIRNYLIPNPEDILAVKGQIDTSPTVEGTKYQGATVIEPTPGIHFNIAVLDFGSLYPTIFKNWNLGYESIRCLHPECYNNVIPFTTHWVCRKKRAIESEVIGKMRDDRINIYKPNPKFKALAGAYKAILMASYGVFGLEGFAFYCPAVAESATAIGRYDIQQAVEKAHTLKIEEIYGDTDSLFLPNDSEKLNLLIEWAKRELDMDLEIDKVFRYVVFSNRKKNYLGVLQDGTVEIKGLTGKKRHTPPFLRKLFDQITHVLSLVNSPIEFEGAKLAIKRLIGDSYRSLQQRRIPLSDLVFTMMAGKEHYEVTPQHIQASGEVAEGTIIRFVKTVEGPKLPEQATPQIIDLSKYTDFMEKTLEQILDPLDLNFNSLISEPIERFI